MLSPDATSGRLDFSSYAVIPLWYGCNSDCSICMLSSLEEKLAAVPYDRFCELVVKLIHDGRRRNLILSGGEVTTFEQLERYIAFAASFRWFSRIQIQTNGRRLADPNYLRRLIDAGVNEFFISLHGPEKVHDAINRRPGAFRQVMTGLDNLARYPEIGVITNTVWTRQNSGCVVPFFAEIARLPFLREMHLWNFFPMGDKPGELVESIPELLKQLPEMAAAVNGKPLVLKAFPHCLPVPAGVHNDNEFPLTLIPDVFWRTLANCGFGRCIHRNNCQSEQCWGLSDAYREKYGEEPELLRPITGLPKTKPV
ncbi:MAG: radical SAM protein [Terracidiphilus sp.]